MSDRVALRAEVVQAFPETQEPTVTRENVVMLKSLADEQFVAYLPSFMIASLDDPMDGDPIPAIIISQITRRTPLARALSAVQRRVLARYVVAMSGDHELAKGHLLKALEELKP